MLISSNRFPILENLTHHPQPLLPDLSFANSPWTTAVWTSPEHSPEAQESVWYTRLSHQTPPLSPSVWSQRNTAAKLDGSWSTLAVAHWCLCPQITADEGPLGSPGAWVMGTQLSFCFQEGCGFLIKHFYLRYFKVVSAPHLSGALWAPWLPHVCRYAPRWEKQRKELHPCFRRKEQSCCSTAG